MIKTKKKTVQIKPEVFRFWDGTKNRGMDTFKLLIDLQDNMTFDVTESLKQLENGEISAGTLSKFLGLFRKVFKVQDYEESDDIITGLTDLQMIKVIKEFMIYIQDKKKDFNAMQI